MERDRTKLLAFGEYEIDVVALGDSLGNSSVPQGSFFCMGKVQCLNLPNTAKLLGWSEKND